MYNVNLSKKMWIYWIYKYFLKSSNELWVLAYINVIYKLIFKRKTK